MVDNDNKTKLDISKLIGLWAFSECALGGLLHAFQIPFSGLLLAAVAVTIISCIGIYSVHPFRDILYGTMVAIAIKASLSPHSPVMAYLAVGFQGLLGALIFASTIRSRWLFIVFGALALVESALQKMLTLTIVFGKPIWEALDALALQVASYFYDATYVPFALSIVLVYAGLYLIWGGIVGNWAYELPEKINMLSVNGLANKMKPSEPLSTPKKKRLKKLIFITGFILLVFYVLIWSATGNVWLLIRPVIIILLWYFFINPLFIRLLKRWTQRRRDDHSQIFEQIVAEIPGMRLHASAAWTYASDRYRGLNRIRYFLLTLITLVCAKDNLPAK